MKLLLSAALLALPSFQAAAQSDPVNPFEITCAQLLAPGDENQRIAANMMVIWSVGYFYGRFGAVEGSNLTPDGYDQAVADLVGALKQICPNVPDMPIATFMENFGNDFAATLEAQQ